MNNFPLDKVYSQIKSETNKYSDISNVYQKLQDSGHVKSIYDLFQQIFIQEKKYTYEEISKIMQAYPNKKINLESQLKLNGAIFKTNFHLIVDIIIDMIHTDVYNNEQNLILASSSNSLSEIWKPEKAQKSMNFSSQKITSPINKSPKNSSKKQAGNFKGINLNNNNSMNYPKEERKNPRIENSKISQGLSTSMVITRNDAVAFKKKKKQVKGEPSSALTNNMSFYSQKNLKLNQSTNSFYSHSVIYPNLDSEFSYIGGKSTYTFSKTERLKNTKDSSPGLKYDPEKATKIVRQKSPEIKFDKAAKTSWFDDKFKAGSLSPGFIYNPSKHFTSK